MSRDQSGQSPAAFERFGVLLRYLRRRARLTQRELSIAVGYSESQISRIEQGHRPPDEETLRALFVPALDLEAEPAWAERLLDLAALARATRTGATPSFERPAPAVPSLPPGLLATKLFRPRQPDPLVPRPRLHARLDQALTVPLSLVAAPAGFGKTTLIAAWLQTLDRQARLDGRPALGTGWLALDEGDNDLAGFLRYLVAALRFCTATSSIGAATLAALDRHEVALPALLTPLLNELTQCAGTYVLVLDDYHAISDLVIQQAMAMLVERLPPHFHLVIISREDPALSLARLRARRQMIEIRAADLRFGFAEASAFLNETMAVPISDTEAATLTRRTEGWVVGLQFAALALRDRQDRAPLIASFTGSNRYLVDYLASEVLDRVPAQQHSFLLQTSILDRMCAELCDTLLDLDAATMSAHSAYSQHMLEELERAHLFVVPLDDERAWYRYHNLFGEVLRSRLQRSTTPDFVAALHMRASAWFAQRDLLDEAVRHALAAGPDQAAALIAYHSLQLSTSGRLAALGSYIRQLPDRCLHDYPELAIFRAWALLLYGNRSATEHFLQQHTTLFARSDLDPEVRGSRLVIDAALLLERGDARAAAALLDQINATELGPRTTGTARFYRSAAAIALGDLATAQTLVAELLRDGASRHSPLLFWRSLSNIGMALLRCGRLSDLVQLVESETVLANQNDTDTPLLGVPDLLLGVVAYQRNKLAEAERLLERGIKRLWAGVEWKLLLMGVATLALVRQARGDAAAATVGLEQALDWTEQMLREERSFVRGLMIEAALNLALARDDLPAARGFAIAAGTALLPRARIHLALTEARHGADNALNAEHRRWLDEAIAACEATGDTNELIRLLGMRALAAQITGDPTAAQAALKRAMELGEPEGNIRTLVDLGPAVADLLQVARSHGGQPGFAERLLAAFNSDHC